jgi:hypothetical protein
MYGGAADSLFMKMALQKILVIGIWINAGSQNIIGVVNLNIFSNAFSF